MPRLRTPAVWDCGLLDRGEVVAGDDRQMMLRAVDPLEDRQGPPDLLPRPVQVALSLEDHTDVVGVSGDVGVFLAVDGRGTGRLMEPCPNGERFPASAVKRHLSRESSPELTSGAVTDAFLSLEHAE